MWNIFKKLKHIQLPMIQPLDLSWPEWLNDLNQYIDNGIIGLNSSETVVSSHFTNKHARFINILHASFIKTRAC